MFLRPFDTPGHAAGFSQRKGWTALLLSVWLGLPSYAIASEVSLVGILGNKAVLVVDGGRPRTIAVGQQTPEGVKLLAVSSATGSAKIEADGTVQHVELGRAPVRIDGTSSGAVDLTLTADTQGHHLTLGSINGASIRFMVDTGATSVGIGIADARRAGVDLSGATPIGVQTASGVVRGWRVRLDTVRVGPLEMHGVEGIVLENNMPVALLGMSFLSRTEMTHEGNRLTLRKRY
ncbi:retropepsin-like aspartic protease family protein [Pseudothauera rhizosphaerae]|uniref:TIGR02281 family clan AA aspartic protease n=1 Tax=Pseudothauera rhizosphaerae TaxID=2565932 RepID=A0A4V3WBT7_9RHOO|nr:TIGR02281 family clan AA aspartic protease [Pseudothauera rhizosphaerae]THF64436.1 TIGR02281 family clan AA aspartic protease [Pseudothauera rhizosphaerae]